MVVLERFDGGKFGWCGKFCGVGIWNNLFLVLFIIVVVVGFVIGVFVNFLVNWIKDFEKKVLIIMFLFFLGELLLNMLWMIIFLLVIVSFIIVVVGLNVIEVGKIGCWILIYYLLIMVLVVFLGVLLVLIIKFGKEDKFGKGGLFFKKMEYRNLDFILDVIRYVKFIL